MSRYKEIVEQIKALEKEAEAVRKQELATVISDIKSKMEEYGITVEDLAKAIRGGRSRRGMPKGVVKYRHPETGQEWTGIGRMPAWVKAEIQKGRSLEAFRV